MSIELMLAAVNINLVAFGAFHNAVDRAGVRAVRPHDRRRRGRRRPRDRAAHLPQPPQCRPRRRRRVEGLTADVLPRPRVAHPADPGASRSSLILFFGKRFPRKRLGDRHHRGRRVVRAVVRRGRAVDPPGRRTPTTRTVSAARSARSDAASAACGAERRRARVLPVDPPRHVVRRTAGVKLTRRHPDRRPRRDDDVRRHADLAARARLLDSSTCAATGATRTSTPR